MKKKFNHLLLNYSLPTIERKTIDGRRVYISPDGDILHSVTTILSHDPVKKESLKKWRARVGEEQANAVGRKATSSGKSTHDAVEKLLENNPIPSVSINPNAIRHYANIKRVLIEKVDNIRHIEAKLFSTKMKAAGATDLIADFDGEIAVIDHKTSAKPKKKEWIKDYFEQTAAYAEMYEEMTSVPITKLVIIISHGDGVDVHVERKDDHLPDFIKKCDAYNAALLTNLAV